MTDTIAFTNEDLFSLIARSGLLNEKAFAAQKLRFQTDDWTPKTILSQMLTENLLTPFQAKQLAERRHRGFFLSEKYKILEFLGQGGMSRVLLCEHLLLQRLVAVKILNKSLDKFPGAADRFLREARASAAMDHPNIARIFDVDRTGLGPCIVMEFIDGANLHDIAVKREILSINRVAHYISQAAAGLQHAHEAGLVHRDVKPANLMLDRTGTVKLLDLGLARFFDPSRSDNLTQQIDSTCIIGTADYIAPEQVMESSSVDIRADIYSLGYSMYFLLTRTLPAGTGAAMRKLLWHQTRDPEPIQNLRPEVPIELAAILERMIKKKPDERFQTPAEVIAALAPWTMEPISPPSEEEMPRTKALQYRLGLCPPPDSSKVAGAAASIPSPDSGTRSTANNGATSSPAPIVASHETETQPAMSCAIGYTTAQDGEAFVASTSAVQSTNTAEVMSAATATDATSGSSFSRKLTESTTAADQFTHRYLVSLLGMALTFIVGLWVAQRLFSPLMPTNDTKDAVARQSAAPAAVTDPVPLNVVLRSGGSTFIRPVMERWSRLYEKQTGVHIEYSAVGSSKGVDGLLANFLDFGCSDACVTDEQLADSGARIVHIPLAMGAVVPTYNVIEESGVPVTLRFTGPLLANIYLGKVKKWNDAAIALINPHQNLPEIDIIVVYRKDGSGTTAIWTDYLSKVNSTWKQQIGTGNKVNWPVGIAAEKNDGVADTVSRTAGSIGYVELSYALANSLQVGAVKNQSGTFVEPTTDAITAAAEASLRTIPPDLRFTLTNAPGTGSYPIVGTCWSILRTDQAAQRGTASIGFLRWATTEGQSHVAGLNFGRLPVALSDRIQAVLEKIPLVE